MQLIVNLNSNDFEVPYDHSYQLYSSVISLVSKQNQEIASQIHGLNSNLKFSLSQLMPGGKRKFTKVGFTGERFVFIISSQETSLIYTIKNSLEMSGAVELFDNRFEIHSIFTRNVIPSAEIVTIKSRSPIILKNDNRYFFKESPEEIQRVLESNIIAKFQKVRGIKPNIRFIKIQGLKLKQVGFKGIKLPGLMVKFTISADIEVLTFILTVGLGSKNKLGFGFIEEEKQGDSDGF